jgi:class 3 adenylate cyclase
MSVPSPGLSLRSQLMLMLISVSAAAMLVIAFLGYHSGELNLTTRIFQQLTSIRASKAYQMQSYFRSLYSQTEALSEDLMVVDAMKEFRSAYQELETRSIPESWRQSIDQFYRESFLPQLHRRGEGSPIADLYKPHDSAGEYLQYHYIASNLNTVGGKQQLLDAGDGSQYSRTHARYHPVFRRYHDLFGYEDLFLVDPESGAIVYSVLKEVDFATSLVNGPYRHSNLANAVRAAINANARGFVKIVDFDHYLPSSGAPAAFLAAPIVDADQLVGVLAIQVPVDEINRVMTGNRNWQKDGLGLSGETYLVGPDHAMRSVSRFLEEDAPAYLEMLEGMNVSSEAIDDIRRYGTTILAQKLDTEAIRNALDRREGTMIVDDYRGIRVLSSFAPLNVKGLDWAVLSEVDLDEAFAPVNAFKRQILVWGSLSILLITMASLWLSSLFIQPVRRLINSAVQIRSGEINSIVTSENSGEFGELAEALSGMVDRLQSLTRASDEQGRQRLELLYRLLPSAAADRLLNGETAIVEPLENVSVMVTEIIGFNSFARLMSGEQKLRLFHDLVGRFDSQVEACGVDKVGLFGDYYVSAGGLSMMRLDHIGRMVTFALEMQAQVRRFNQQHGCNLNVASSIHSADVAAGVIGTTRMIYDVRGDAESIARGMLSQAESTSGAILVSEPVYEFLHDVYAFERVERTAAPAVEPAIAIWRLTGIKRDQVQEL